MDAVPRLKELGGLDDRQAARLTELQSGRLFSLHAELRACLYIGALFIVIGVGATVAKYFSELGHFAIIVALTLAVVASYGYCFLRAKPYRQEQVPSPTAAFDYILYLGCAFLGVEFGYIEHHFHLLDRYWDYYLLISGLWFLILAYRHDNRLCLAMALVNLAGWLGVRLDAMHMAWFPRRAQALCYGLAVCLAGFGLAWRAIKPHFRDTYLNIGLNVLFWAVLSGVFVQGWSSPYNLVLASLAASSAVFGLKERLFQYFLYGIAYAYIGFSSLLLREIHGAQEILLYFLVSASALIYIIFNFRRLLEQKR